MLPVFVIISAYLLGSISTAILVCKMFGFGDPRQQGSNNPGVTNVMRLGGKKPAFITLVGDFLKGLIPVLIAKWLGLDHLYIGITMLAAFFGHIFPIFFHFKGGKGLATFFGVIFAFNYVLGMVIYVVWMIGVKLTNLSSVGALISVICAPIISLFFIEHKIYIFIIAILSITILFTHRANIRRIINKTEPKISK